MEEIEIKKFVGARIKHYRQKKNLTQFKLGEMIDINQRQIAQIECGKSFPSLSTLLKLSTVLQHNISDFFETDTELREKDLKNLLKNGIEKADYNDCKRLYSVMKNFMNI